MPNRSRWFLSLITLALFSAMAFAAEVPRRSPELALTLPDGQQLLLSKYRGKVVMIEVLLTTCPHCQKATEVITKLHKEYGAKGFQPIGIALDPMPKLVIDDFRKRFGVEYPVGYTDRDSLTNYLQYSPMMRMLVPQLVFIDRDGMIQAQIPGGDKFFENEEANIRAVLDKLLPMKGKAAANKK